MWRWRFWLTTMYCCRLSRAFAIGSWCRQLCATLKPNYTKASDNNPEKPDTWIVIISFFLIKITFRTCDKTYSGRAMLTDPHDGFLWYEGANLDSMSDTVDILVAFWCKNRRIIFIQVAYRMFIVTKKSLYYSCLPNIR